MVQRHFVEAFHVGGVVGPSSSQPSFTQSSMISGWWSQTAELSATVARIFRLDSASIRRNAPTRSPSWRCAQCRAIGVHVIDPWGVRAEVPRHGAIERGKNWISGDHPKRDARTIGQRPLGPTIDGAVGERTVRSGFSSLTDGLFQGQVGRRICCAIFEQGDLVQEGVDIAQGIFGDCHPASAERIFLPLRAGTQRRARRPAAGDDHC